MKSQNHCLIAILSSLLLADSCHAQSHDEGQYLSVFEQEDSFARRDDGIASGKRSSGVRGLRLSSSPRNLGGDGSASDSFHVPKGEGLKEKYGGKHKRRAIVTYDDESGHEQAVMHANRIVQDHEDDNVIVLECLGACLDDLRTQQGIQSARYDFPIEAASSNFPHGDFHRTLEEYIPWGMMATQMHDMPMGEKSDVLICIADTGIAIGHPDFNTDFISGTDTVQSDGTVWHWDEDHSGHGTHVAGTIAALHGNDVGVRGAGNFRLHIVRALDDTGAGYESDTIRAIQQCVDEGADIINLSLGGPFISRQAFDLIDHVVNELGIMMVAAAGNFGVSDLFYPAGHPSVISVAASYHWGRAVEWSNWGIQIELSAPGYDILSTTVSTSAVQTSDHGFPAFPVPGAQESSVTGQLVDCGRGEAVCDSANGNICLMVRGDKKVKDMVKNCIEGGGIGAVIYSDRYSRTSQNQRKIWGCSSKDCTIPVVRVKSGVGQEIRNTALYEMVTVGDSDGDGAEYTYDFLSGTSMASPHVAAAAGLVWSSTYNSCSNQQIRYALAITAIDLPLRLSPQGQAFEPDGCDWGHGYGMVRAQSALQWLQNNDCADWDIPTSMEGGCCIVETIRDTNFVLPSYCS